MRPVKKRWMREGLLVTPGFVDVHSHLDGNVTWEQQLKPNSGHGITTTVMGNCGVGFAPVPAGTPGVCRRAHGRGGRHSSREQLNAGLPWNWQSFPGVPRCVARRRYDMNVASLLPHSCLRVFVMGERAIEW